MSSGPTVAAVIVHYRQPAALVDTLRALQEQTAPPSQIVVVDNGDGSACKAVVEEFGVELIAMGRNAGYAAAVNAGVAHVAGPGDSASSEDSAGSGDSADPGDLVLVLTHECCLDPTSIEVMAAALAADASVGVVGPLLGNLDRPETVWSAGGSFGRRSHRPFHRGSGLPLATFVGRPASDVEWLDGACMLARASLFDTVGSLDETWFLYVEEVDWLSRVRDCGWRVVVVPAACGWQRAGIAPPYLEARNLTRWCIRQRDVVGLALFVASQASACVADVRAGDWRVARARLVGLAHGVSGHLAVTYVAVRPAASCAKRSTESATPASNEGRAAIHS